MAAPDVCLREAVQADANAISLLEQECFQGPAEWFSLRKIKALLRNRRCQTIVAVRSEELIGWVNAIIGPPTTRWGRIFALAVAPSARHQKIGRALMSAMLSELSKREVERVYLEVRDDNHAAIALYRSLGFISFRTLTNFYGPGSTALRMELKLLPGVD